LVELHRDELAALESADNGKPVHIANAVWQLSLPLLPCDWQDSSSVSYICSI
jgi:hypothetical protein